MSSARRAEPRTLTWFLAGSLLWAGVDLLHVTFVTGGQPLGKLVAVVLAFYLAFGLVGGAVHASLGSRFRGSAVVTAVVLPGALLLAAHLNFVYLPAFLSAYTLVANAVLLAAAAVLWRAAARSARVGGFAGSRGAAASLALVGLLCAALSASGWSRPHAPSAEAPIARGPDVFVIVIDSLRADRAYRADRQLMPALRELALRGEGFENAYVQASWTKPSVASILSSLFPATHQANYRRDRVSPDAKLLAESFHRNGYRTAVFSANPWVSPAFGFDRGIDVFFETDRETFSRLVLLLRILRASDRAVPGRPFSRAIASAEHAIGIGSDRRSNCERDTVIAAAFQDWMARPSPRPRFAYLHLMSPHLPYRPPAAPEGVSDREQVELLMRTEPLEEEKLRTLVGLYEQTVAHADSVLRSLLDAIRAATPEAGAVIAVTADHGEEFFEHGRFGHGKTLYEEVVRVPLVIAGPGIARGSVRDDPVMLVDLAPTLALLAGIEPEPQWRGSDLRAVDKARLAYAELLREGGLETYMVSDGKRAYIETKEGLGMEARHQLYELGADPGEAHALPVPGSDGLRQALERNRDAARESALARDTTRGDESGDERLRALGYVQ